MAAFLRNILGIRTIQDQAEAFAALPWELSTVDEVLTVKKDELLPEQTAMLEEFAQKKYIADPKWSGYYTIYPPTQKNPEATVLWEAAFPPAEARLNEALKPFLDFPWKFTQTADDNYYFWQGELTPEQKELLEAAPERTFEKDRGIFTIGLRRDDTSFTLSSGGRGRTSNRLHVIIHEKITRELAQDNTVISQLPWEFDYQGNLFLDAGVVENLPTELKLPANTNQKLLRAGESTNISREIQLTSEKAQVEDIIQRRGIKLVEGKYVLQVPNTVSKLWDRPDGETDTGRLEIYEKAQEANLARNGALMQLPWRFDKACWAFVVTDSDLTPVDQQKVEGALQKVGNVYQVHNLKDYSYRAWGPKAQVTQFRDQLAAAVPDDIAIYDLGSLPWKYGHEGLTIPAKDFVGTDFIIKTKGTLSHGRGAYSYGQVNIKAGDKKTIAFKMDYDGNVVIPHDDVDTIPHYTAVKAALEKRYNQFIEEHADEMRSLPWRFRIADKVTDYGTIRIYSDELTAKQKGLLNNLITMNQVHFQYDTQHDVRSALLESFLEPEFEKAKPVTIAKIAELPWVHSSGGMCLVIKESIVTSDQAELLERSGIRRNGWGSYEVRATTSYKGGEDFGETFDQLRRAISANIRTRTKVAEITPEIMAMGWQYAGDYKSKTIVLDDKNLSEKQKADLKAAIPELHHMDMPLYRRDDLSLDRSGYFELSPADDDDIAHAVIDAPYYNALQHIAERRLGFLVKDAAALPWRKNAEGSFELKRSEVTKDQQHLLQQIPNDCFDRKGQFDKLTEFSDERYYLVNANAKDQQLLKAVNSQKVGLPSH